MPRITDKEKTLTLGNEVCHTDGSPKRNECLCYHLVLKKHRKTEAFILLAQ